MVFSNYSVNSLKWIWRAGLMLFLSGSLVACKGTPLYTELDEQQANLVQATLLGMQIDVEKVLAEDGKRWVISVPKDQMPLAMSALTEQGLPQASVPTMGQLFEKKGFVSSPLEERARYLYALSQELSHTLMEIEGVASARVHVALPEKTLLEEERRSASVSVVINQKPGFDLRRYETDIKAIVTDGVEGLDDVNRVTVKFFDRQANAHPVAMKKTFPLAHIAALTVPLFGLLSALLVIWRHRLKKRVATANAEKSQSERLNHA